MKRSMISSLALTAAMLLSTGAMAQTMVGQQSVSAEDLPAVQAQCNTLSAESKESLASDTESDSAASDTTEGSGGEGEDDGAGDLGTETETPNGATAAIDLSLITVEDCKAAGLSQ